MSTWQQHALNNLSPNSTNLANHSIPTSQSSNSQISCENLGEINHTSALSGDFGNLFNQPDYSDLVLIVESEQFHAHRVILAARSDYFRALLYGGLRESRQENQRIEIKECKASAFEFLLRYIYTGRINLIKEKEDVLLDLLGLVHQYGFSKLEESLSIYLKSILSIDNVCTIYDTACLYEMKQLKHQAAQFIDNHASEIIKSDEFLNLSPDAFSSIISRDSFFCPEIEIFYAVKKWHERQHEKENELTKVHGDIVSKVRLALISMNDLLKKVRYSNLFDLNHIMDAIASINDEKTSSSNANTDETKAIITEPSLNRLRSYRGRLRIDENIATKVHSAQVTEGEMKHALLDGDVTNYDLDRGFTRHPIDDVHHICVKLDGPSIINHIKLLLWDKDPRTYSYYIEVSVDDTNWKKIIDYRSYSCRSWQKLYFPPVVASAIRIFGTHNTVNKVFHLVSMEVYYIQKPVALVGDVHAPVNNVATIEASAVVSEGVSRVRNALINGDYHSYDWDSGYTCHQLGSGGIVIELPQPYIVSSMRLLLWDCDTRSYSYYIETSYDNSTWSKAVDKRSVACRSWQILTFSPRVVVFIRIVGTQNTANEVFHCVHFECPCRPDVLQSYLNEQSSNAMTDDRETDSVSYEEFSKSSHAVLNSTNSNNSESDEKLLSIENIITLPFTVKSGSMNLYPIEKSN